MENLVFNGRSEEIKTLFEQILKQIQATSRPAEQIIIDDVDLRDQLKVSARTTAEWRSKRMITYSKVLGKIYYKYSDVLSFIEKYSIESINKTIKIRL